MIEKQKHRESYIVFIDETGFMLGPLVRRTWAPRGKTPVLWVIDPHERISCMGAMTIKRSPLCFGFHFQLLPDNINFNGHSTAAFLSRLRKTLSGPITLIWDEVRIHRASPVKEFILKNPSVEVEELPSYTPELNPVDYVWSYVKFARLSNYCPRNLSELRVTIMAELSKVKNNCNLLRSLFSGTKLSLNGIE